MDQKEVIKRLSMGIGTVRNATIALRKIGESARKATKVMEDFKKIAKEVKHYGNG